MSAASPARAALLAQLAQLCRNGRADERALPPAQPSGFAALDAVLPGGGWRRLAGRRDHRADARRQRHR
jgi:hypothetical protein